MNGFKPSNELATGGRRHNSGMPSQIVRKEIDRFITTYKLLERMAKIAAGEKIFKKHIVVKRGFDSEAIEVECAADPSVQAYVIEKLFDRAYGKPFVQEADGVGPGKSDMHMLVVNFFTILEKLKDHEPIRLELLKALEGTKAVENDQPLQNQGQA